MKFSKSILIFLLASCTVSAFYYSLKRTNGDIGKSIMFTVYFLAIKVGLIGPNVGMLLDKDQVTQEVIRVLPSYTSDYWDYYDRGSRIYMDKIEEGVDYVSYHSKSVIKDVRAGSRVSDAAWLFLWIWMLEHQSVGFQPVQGVRPPHQEAVYNAVFGKPKTDRFSCQNRFPTLLESKKGHHPDKKFYNSEGDCYFSERQLQKKFKHAGDFGIDSNYNSANGKVFEKAIVDHMKTAQQYCGVYHGDSVINYFNETTKLNVMIKKEDKTFISGWSVNKEQVEYIRKGEKYNE